MQTLAIIGSGNIAWHFAHRLKDSFSISCLVSRNETSGLQLRDSLNCGCVFMKHPSEIPKDTDICLIAVNDGSIETVSRDLPIDSIWIHTSGSMPIDILNKNPRRGVVYPLQTFSKDKPYPDTDFPVFIEGSDNEALDHIRVLGGKLTDTVRYLDSKSRLKVHAAAVTGCNFTNYLLDISFRLMEDAGVDFEYLKPLMDETVAKAFSGGRPIDFQTGPAARRDNDVISKHEALLKNEIKETYSFLTEKITTTLNEGNFRQNSSRQ